MKTSEQQTAPLIMYNTVIDRLFLILIESAFLYFF